MEKDNDTQPWSEKYRPKCFNEIISHREIILALKNFIKNDELPHLLLYGPPGTGKTSIIKSLINEIYGDDAFFMTLSINASEERGIGTVRTIITNFAKSKSIICGDDDKKIKKYKIVILDEADSMTIDAQSNLRKVIETYTSKVRFCLICNYIKKINIAIRSRCVCFNFIPLNVVDIKKKIGDVISKENINITDDGIDTLIKRSSGDLRKLLNVLQSLYMKDKQITGNEINRCMHYPSKEVIENIYNSMLNSKFSHIYNLMNEYIESEGYDINNIITELVELAIQRDDLELCQFIKMIGNAEYNIYLRSQDKINIASLVGVFKLNLKKK